MGHKCKRSQKKNLQKYKERRPSAIHRQKHVEEHPSAAHQEECHEEKRLSPALLEEMDRTGYDLVQRNGQRIYGPGPGIVCPTPPRGCEVYVSNIRDKSIFENELIPLFGSVGPLYQFRMMLDFEGNSRGYAYATYFEKTHALEAVRRLHGYRIRADLKLEVTKSKDNTRLFVGAVPETVTRREAFETFSSYVDGIVDVMMLMSDNNPRRNRGYVFLEFETHPLAYKGKRDLRNYRFWKRYLRVEWAEAYLYPFNCVPLPNDLSCDQEKSTLFLTNLPTYFTAKDAMVYINRFIDSCVIADIRKMSHYGFLDFYSRATAEFALVALNGLVMAGRKIKVDWAHSPTRTSFKTLKSDKTIAESQIKMECTKPMNSADECNNFLKLLDFTSCSTPFDDDENMKNMAFSDILPCFLFEYFSNEEIQECWSPIVV